MFSAQGCAQRVVQPLGTASLAVGTHNSFFITPDQYALPFDKYWPHSRPKALVIALHGFNDYKHAFVDLCRFMVSRSIACLAYDQRGFGETEYRGVWPESGAFQRDLVFVVSEMRKQHPDLPVYVLGESMGGAVTMTAQASHAELFKQDLAGSIVLAPAVWAPSTQPWYQRALLWLAVHTFPSWSPTGEGLGVQASDNIEALRAMGRDELVIKKTRVDAIYGLNQLMGQALRATMQLSGDILYLYGENDQVIPAQPSCEAISRLFSSPSNLEVSIYPRGYHMLTRDLMRNEVFADIVRWIEGKDLRTRNSLENVENFCDASL